MSNTPAPKADNVINFPKPRRRDETMSYEVERPTTAKNETLTVSDLGDGLPTIKTLVPEQVRAPAYAPLPGESFDLFMINELRAGETLQSLFKPVRTAFIILRGTAQEFVPDARGEYMEIRRLEVGDLVNASLFAPEVDVRGAEVEVRAMTDLLMYVITTDALEAYDVSDEKRARVRRNRERYLQAALARMNVQLFRNRNGIAQSIDETKLMAEGAAIAAADDAIAREKAEQAASNWKARAEELDRIIRDTLQERIAEHVEARIKPLREENERLRKDRVVDMRSLEITLDGVDDLIGTEVEQSERRIAELVVVVEDGLLTALGLSENPEKSEIIMLKQKTTDALSELFTFKMKPPKAFNKPKDPAPKS